MSRLREALDRHDYGVHSPAEIHQVIIPAARRFLALTETGQRVLWCEAHNAEGIENHGGASDECWRVVWADHKADEGLPLTGYRRCRIVERLVIPADYLTEEET